MLAYFKLFFKQAVMYIFHLKHSKNKFQLYYRQSPDLPPFRVPSRLLQELLRLTRLRGSPPARFVDWHYECEHQSVVDNLSQYDSDVDRGSPPLDTENGSTVSSSSLSHGSEPVVLATTTTAAPPSDQSMMVMTSSNAPEGARVFYTEPVLDTMTGSLVGFEVEGSGPQKAMIRDPRVALVIFWNLFQITTLNCYFFQRNNLQNQTVLVTNDCQPPVVNMQPQQQLQPIVSGNYTLIPLEPQQQGIPPYPPLPPPPPPLPPIMACFAPPPPPPGSGDSSMSPPDDVITTNNSQNPNFSVGHNEITMQPIYKGSCQVPQNFVEPNGFQQHQRFSLQPNYGYHNGSTNGHMMVG